MRRLSGLLLAVLLVFVSACSTQTPDAEEAFLERGGLVAVEAEHFSQHLASATRAWYRFDPRSEPPPVQPDGDANHAASASGASYLELLPDTRRTHEDPLIHGENFSNEPGQLALLSYPVRFETAGRYYVWVRAYSTGTEDNGLHVGLNGHWPASGQRMQWCEGKDQWTWASKQRTEEVHCGLPGHIYLDIAEPGLHTIWFSMREDGFEFDKWILTTDPAYTPQGNGPDELREMGGATR